MSKKLLLLVAVIVLALLLPSAVFAGPGGLAYSSGIQVVNLSSDTANIGLTYYNQDGSSLPPIVDSIAGNSSKTYFPIQAPVGFNGSLVVSSDKPITAIANTQANSGTIGAASTSFSSGATVVNLPLVMCNNAGYNTWFNIQNAGTGTASVNIQYTAGLFGADDSESANVEPGASQTFDQATGSSTVNCSTLAGGDGKFVGGATITSDEPVVATVMQLNSPDPHLLAYNGFTSGSQTVALPLVMANNPNSTGFFTGIQIQNTGASTAAVVVDYSPNNAGAFQPVNEVFNLAAGASKTILQAGASPGNGSANTWTGNRYVGGATVTADQDLVVIVNQILPKNAQVGTFGTAYEGFDPASGTENVAAPLIMANNPTSAGFFTGVQIMNVGGGACPAISMDYSPNLNGTFQPLTETINNLASGSSFTIIQAGNAGGNGSINTWIGHRYVGSAYISAPGCSVIAIVNEQVPLMGDGLYTYNGYNTP